MSVIIIVSEFLTAVGRRVSQIWIELELWTKLCALNRRVYRLVQSMCQLINITCDMFDVGYAILIISTGWLIYHNLLIIIEHVLYILIKVFSIYLILEIGNEFLEFIKNRQRLKIGKTD